MNKKIIIVICLCLFFVTGCRKSEAQIIVDIQNYLKIKYNDEFIFNKSNVYSSSNENGESYTVICGYLKNNSNLYFCATEDREYDNKNGFDEKNPNYYDSKEIVEYIRQKYNQDFTFIGETRKNMSKGESLSINHTRYCGYINSYQESEKTVCITENLNDNETLRFEEQRY